MNISFTMTEVAIFSLDRFVFGVDTQQIKEIFTVSTSAIIAESEPMFPFFVIQYHQQPLPVFDLRRRFCLPVEPRNILYYPVVAFQTTHFLAAYWVTAVEDIQSVSFRALRPVPALLTRIARRNHVWGFYENEGKLLPLFDLEQMISAADLDLYVSFLSKFSLFPGIKTEK